METVRDSIVNNTADCVVPLGVVIPPRSTESPLSCNEVELEIVSVVDPTQTSKVRLLIGVLGGTIIWSNEGAVVVFGTEHDAGCVSAAELVAVFDVLAVLGGDVLGVVVAPRVTLLSKHEMRLCIIRTSSSLSFESGVCPRRS